MQAQLDMIGIITSNFPEMKKFYQEVLGFKVKLEMENFVEFENEGIRLAISTSEVMHQATGDADYKQPKQGHSFELAFKANSPEEVDNQYNQIISKGAKAIKTPADMPWGQRTAFFSDPDNNIHEIFADLSN